MRRVTPLPAKRRDKRYLVGLPVTLFLSKRWIEAETGDVGHGGVFVLLDEELHDGPVSIPVGASPGQAGEILRTGSLVRVEIALPPDGEPFSATGRLVHQRPAFARDERRGVGVEFYGVGLETKERWSAFIELLRTNYPASDERLVTLATAEQVDATYLRSHHQVGALRVEPGSVRDLAAMLNRDVSRGTIFLVTSATAFVDDELLLQIIHPLTEDVFELTGRVRRIVQEAGLRGLDLSLVHCDDERQARFEEFVYDAMAGIFDEEEVERE